MDPKFYRRWFSIPLALAVWAPCGVTLAAGDETAEPAQGHDRTPPTELLQWLASAAASDTALAEELSAELYSAYEQARDSAGAELAVLRAAEVVGRADAKLGALMETAIGDLPGVVGRPPASFGDQPPAIRAAVGLRVAAELHAHRCYEEALAWLESVEASQSVAPHLVHYLRAVAFHQLVNLERAAQSAQHVVDEPGLAGARHVSVCELIVRDSRAADPESLGHLARTMNDIRRRLGIGRAGEPEQDLQQKVIDALDKIIEEAEKQQQQQQQAGGSSPAPSSKPMEDSRPAELKGPGDVDRRQIAQGGDWGSLPPRERERVTQQIGRDFPAYYRDLIEAYFRSLASEESQDEAAP